MSAENAREFVDANVLVYAYDASAGKKKIAAQPKNSSRNCGRQATAASAPRSAGVLRHRDSEGRRASFGRRRRNTRTNSERVGIASCIIC